MSRIWCTHKIERKKRLIKLIIQCSDHVHKYLQHCNTGAYQKESKSLGLKWEDKQSNKEIYKNTRYKPITTKIAKMKWVLMAIIFYDKIGGFQLISQ